MTTVWTFVAIAVVLFLCGLLLDLGYRLGRQDGYDQGVRDGFKEGQVDKDQSWWDRAEAEIDEARVKIWREMS